MVQIFGNMFGFFLGINKLKTNTLMIQLFGNMFGFFSWSLVFTCSLVASYFLLFFLVCCVLFFQNNRVEFLLKKTFLQKVKQQFLLFTVTLISATLLLSGDSKASAMNPLSLTQPLALPIYSVDSFDTCLIYSNSFSFSKKSRKRKKVVCKSLTENQKDFDYTLQIEISKQDMKNLSNYVDLNECKLLTTPTNDSNATEKKFSEIEVKNFNLSNNCFQTVSLTGDLNTKILAGIKLRAKILKQLETPNSALAISMANALKTKTKKKHLATFFANNFLNENEKMEFIFKFLKTLTPNEEGRFSMIATVYPYSLRSIVNHLFKVLFDVFQEISKQNKKIASQKDDAFSSSDFDITEISAFLAKSPSVETTQVTPESLHFCHFVPKNVYKIFELEEDEMLCIILPSEFNLSMDAFLFNLEAFWFETGENTNTFIEKASVSTMNPSRWETTYDNRLTKAEMIYFTKTKFKEVEALSNIQYAIIKKRLSFCSTFYLNPHQPILVDKKINNFHNRVCQKTQLPPDGITLDQDYLLSKLFKTFEPTVKESLFKLILKEFNKMDLSEYEPLFTEWLGVKDNDLKAYLKKLQKNSLLNDKVNGIIDCCSNGFSSLQIAILGASFFHTQKGFTSGQLDSFKDISYCKKLIIKKKGKICMKNTIKENITSSEYGNKIIEKSNSALSNLKLNVLEPYIFNDLLLNYNLDFLLKEDPKIKITKEDRKRIYEGLKILLKIIINQVLETVNVLEASQPETLINIMVANFYLREELLKNNNKLSFSTIQKIFEQNNLNFTFSQDFFNNKLSYDNFFYTNWNKEDIFDFYSLFVFFSFLTSLIKEDNNFFVDLLSNKETNNLNNNSLKVKTKKSKVTEEFALLEKVGEIINQPSLIKQPNSKPRRKTTKSPT